MTPPALEDLLNLYADYNALECAIGLLNWDRQVLMPPGGAAARTAQVGILTRKAHELLTSHEMASKLEQAKRETEPSGEAFAMLRCLQREVDIETKLPAELVARKTQAASDAYEVWKIAKATNNFAQLAPYYEQLFDIARETATLLGYTDHIYDPLIDLYEQGAKCADATTMFNAIKAPIVELVRRINSEGRPIDDSFMWGDWNKDDLIRFAERTLGLVGFDFNRGRLNLAPNAFCMNLSCNDVRMTSRASNHLKGIVSSSLHEMGHALYEQNSPQKWDRTPIAGGVSNAVHESQSRLWENIVGRSRGFWSHFLPDLKSTFPSLSEVNSEAFYAAVNRVEPEYIRVGADELTYNLHILVRFELEVEILTNQIRIADLPEAWNAKYTDYLGITPPTDSVGCLQDVHWSRGAVGYFPTYAMGNLIGAQMWSCLQNDIPDTSDQMSSGNFKPILEWLVDKVYSKGKSIQPRELVTQITGRPLDASSWLSYVSSKYEDLYRLS